MKRYKVKCRKCGVVHEAFRQCAIVWRDGDVPTSCGVNVVGEPVHVFPDELGGTRCLCGVVNDPDALRIKHEPGWYERSVEATRRAIASLPTWMRHR